jgi:hypothetical protein
LAAVSPKGGTPMLPAFLGALQHLKQYQSSHAGHLAAVVMATDGSPSGCENADTPQVAASIATAYAAMPSIPTYIIGVLDPGQASDADLNQLAMAGGTGTAFPVSATADLGASFLTTLNEIRGKALPCAFVIPTPAGNFIDYGKVNVRHNSTSGPTDLLYVGSADHCDAGKGGWYYDVDPKMGKPTQVQICASSCRSFKTDPGGSVELRFGCLTRIN